MALQAKYHDHVSLVVPRWLKERLDADADAKAVSMAQVVRDVLTAHYDGVTPGDVDPPYIVAD